MISKFMPLDQTYFIYFNTVKHRKENKLILPIKKLDI